VRIYLPPAAWVRAACLAAFSVVVAQLFFLDEPPIVRELKSFMWDKSLHAMAFGSFSLLLWFGIGYRNPLANWFTISAIAVLDEIHQVFVPTRTADVFDVLADMIGAAIVTYILHRLSQPRASAAPVSRQAVVQPGD
jgi:VanZ family protein